MLTFTSCKNSVRCKRWIQHQRFFSVRVVSCSKSVFFGCLNRVVDGYDIIKKRGPTADGQPRKIYSRQFGRITWHLSPRRGEPDLKTGESLFISLLVSWKSLGTLSAGPSFVTLIQHVRQLLSKGWLRLWLQAIVWAVAVRSLPRCCDRSPQKGQTRTHSLLEAFIATVHPQLMGVHSIGETKDGNNNNVH